MKPDLFRVCAVYLGSFHVVSAGEHPQQFLFTRGALALGTAEKAECCALWPVLLALVESEMPTALAL